jgi:signal peptide peptidase SppA
MNDLLDVPTFARLIDYIGPWLIEPTHFASLWQMASEMNLAAHVEKGSDPLKAAVEKLPGPGGRSLAVIKVTGLMMKSQSSFGGTSTIQLRRDIRQAAADDDVAAILLAIDSPGGTVAGTDDLAADVRGARKSKPVWAHIDDLCASAGYWLASQCDRITANSPTAMVGSIGTFQVIYDRSGAAEKDGIKTLLFATGPLKGLGTPGSKITDEQVAHVQSLVNSVQESFDAAVQKGRGLTDKQLAAVRHGGVMTASEAMDKKLVDAVQPLSKTIAELMQSARSSQRGTAASAETEPITVVDQGAAVKPGERSPLGDALAGLHGVDVPTAQEGAAGPTESLDKTSSGGGALPMRKLGGLPTLATN